MNKEKYIYPKIKGRNYPKIYPALNAQVDPTTLSERVTTFFGYLGAGGKMTLLPPPQQQKNALPANRKSVLI